jgi:DNA end-binding protein Ku
VRAIWRGAVSFGLVNVPVRLFAATQEHDIRFHQVHRADAGRIRMRRICSVCGEEVPYDQLAKGYESPDGRVVMLDDEDFANLPLVTGKEIDVVEFVPSEQVDPILFDRTYYLEPEARAAKPYALLREALTATDRMAVVKVALRQRESMAVLRVRDRVIVMQTLLWPDEVRAPDFEVLDNEVELRPQELTMAESLIESLSADFDPDRFEDRYATAVAEMVEAKLAGAPPAPAPAAEAAATDVADLLTALQRSVERARATRGEPPPADAAAVATAATGTDAAAAGTPPEAADATGAGRRPAKRTAGTTSAGQPARKATTTKKAAAGDPATSDGKATTRTTSKTPTKTPAEAPAKKAAQKATPQKATARKTTTTQKATTRKATTRRKSA